MNMISVITLSSRRSLLPVTPPARAREAAGFGGNIPRRPLVLCPWLVGGFVASAWLGFILDVWIGGGR